jgi:hypothetical protein
MTGQQPRDMSRELRVWRKLSDEEKAVAQADVEEWNFDAYDAALPAWMQRLVVTASTQTVPLDTAIYLEGVAWEEYKAMQLRLATALGLGDRATTELER